MGFHTRFLLLLSFVVVFCSEAAANVIYVSKRLLPLNADGTSWVRSFQTVTEALQVAVAGDEIWVARGRYVPGQLVDARFELIEEVALYGGFAGNEAARNDRDWQANLTILSGDIDDNDFRDLHGVTRTVSAIRGTNSRTVVYLPSTTTSTAVIDGFIITGGDAETHGGGLYSNGSAAQVRDLLVVGNRAATRGGGVYLTGSNLTAEGLQVQSNGAQYGAGVACYSSSAATFRDCSVQGNEASLDGGGFRIHQSDVIGLNLLVTGNKARSGGGVYVHNSSPLFVNLTLASNLAVTSGAGGITSGGSASVALHNAIVWGNYRGFAHGSAEQLSGTFVIDEATIEGGGCGCRRGYGLAGFPQSASGIDRATLECGLSRAR